jgi:hypothetical protein
VLPALIRGLRQPGFELVTISGLLGMTRDALMPPVEGESVATVGHRVGWESRRFKGAISMSRAHSAG